MTQRLSSCPCVPAGHEGRAGMAAVVLKQSLWLDGRKLYDHLVETLPSYAWPRFLRVQVGPTEVFRRPRVVETQLILLICVFRPLWMWQRHSSSRSWGWSRRALILMSVLILCTSSMSLRRNSFLWLRLCTRTSYLERSAFEDLRELLLLFVHLEPTWGSLPSEIIQPWQRKTENFRLWYLTVNYDKYNTKENVILSFTWGAPEDTISTIAVV